MTQEVLPSRWSSVSWSERSWSGVFRRVSVVGVGVEFIIVKVIALPVLQPTYR